MSCFHGAAQGIQVHQGECEQAHLLKRKQKEMNNVLVAMRKAVKKTDAPIPPLPKWTHTHTERGGREERERETHTHRDDRQREKI